MSDSPHRFPPGSVEADVARDEGWREWLYDDATGKRLVRGDTLQGNISGGYGRNFSANPLSPDEGGLLFSNNMAEATWAVGALLGQDSPPVGSARFKALVNAAFTLGFEGLGGFHECLAAVRAGQWTRAAHELRDSVWGRSAARHRCLVQAFRLRHNRDPEPGERLVK